MKALIALFFAVVCVVVSGCDSISDVREKFAQRDEPRTKTFSAPPRVVYDAVKQAANNMGYRFVRGGPAQGIFEAVSSVGPGETSGSARQIGVKVRLHATLDQSGTDVSVRFTEIVESDSNRHMGMGTETTMRDTPLYEVFFRNIQQALGTRPVAQPVQPATPQP